MAHPFNNVRDHKVQHSRVSSITKACGGMASGGHTDVAEDKALISKMVKKTALRATGGAVKARSDRPARARGGRTKGKGLKKGSKHTVNVIVAPQSGNPGMPPRPPGPPGVAAGPPPGLAPPMPPRPPMAGPAGPAGGVPGGPAMPPGVPPPGLMRKRGGAVFSGTPNKVSVNAKRTTGIGNKATSQTAGAGRGRTPIRKSFPSNKSDTPNIGRGPVITKATGGTVNAAPAETIERATGGPISSPAKGGMGPQFSGGARGGMAKLEKAARLAKQKYGRPTVTVKNPTQNPAP